MGGTAPAPVARRGSPRAGRFLPPARGPRARGTTAAGASTRRVALAARTASGVRAGPPGRLAARLRPAAEVSRANDGDSHDRSWWRMVRARLGFSFEVLRS